MRSLLFLLLFILAAAVFTSAQDEAITFSLERHDIQSIVTLNSTKKFPCQNYRMDTRDYQNVDTIIIIIRDFIAPTPCKGAKAVAEEKFTLTPNTKRFYLKLWYKGKFDKWRIFQGDTAYLVRPEGVSFSAYTELKK